MRIREGILRHAASRSDRADLTGVVFREPEISIGTRGDGGRPCLPRGQGKLPDLPGGSDAPDFVAYFLGEPCYRLTATVTATPAILGEQ